MNLYNYKLHYAHTHTCARAPARTHARMHARARLINMRYIIFVHNIYNTYTCVCH